MAQEGMTKIGNVASNVASEAASKMGGLLGGIQAAVIGKAEQKDET